MVLEQFKSTVSSRVATYINEQSVKTPEEAAVLANDVVLTHRTTFVDVHVCDVQSPAFVKSPSKLGCVFTGKFDSSKTLNYCNGNGY